MTTRDWSTQALVKDFSNMHSNNVHNSSKVRWWWCCFINLSGQNQRMAASYLFFIWPVGMAAGGTEEGLLVAYPKRCCRQPSPRPAVAGGHVPGHAAPDDIHHSITPLPPQPAADSELPLLLLYFHVFLLNSLPFLSP
jgi:hypothetical protein